MTIHFRLHREALKQSATDPRTGLIDVNILATGLSVSDRQRRVEIAKALKTVLQAKTQAPNTNIQRLFEDFRAGSDVVRCGREGNVVVIVIALVAVIVAVIVALPAFVVVVVVLVDVAHTL